MLSLAVLVYFCVCVCVCVCGYSDELIESLCLA